ncbi:hypothetical protein Syun_006282 [Stephania yunnanensis]|uniref:Uncharacterized protein n=1 Tax=Stephania yunnanensis TaxID=152371 RepID=A0AAP0Q174_9MAGN
MAEAILVDGVEEIVKRLISLGIDEIGLLRGVEEEVEKLQTIFTDIQYVLQDAEKKQVGDERVGRWLRKLKEAAYDAEDILADFAFHGLRRQVHAKTKTKVLNFFSCFASLPLKFKTAHSIQNITKRLKDIDEEKVSFRFIPFNTPENVVPNVVDAARETTSLVNESDAFGRETDKVKIVDMLISDPGSSSTDAPTTTLSIVTILGLGGLGKTTLAQLVFKDATVKEHFGSMMIWVCVSEDFAVTTIWFKILKEIDSSSAQSESSSKQELQKKLEKELSGKKLLVVLDDCWHKDLHKWEELILPLKVYGAAGSKVVVTTREENVASTIGSSYTHYLQLLSDDQCLRLFESKAFVQGETKNSNLVKIGEEIVKKCRGVPLAVKVLGGLMRSKRTEQEWLVIRDGEFWQLGGDVQKQVIEILKLSYNNLPPKVRQCFSYCSIFPKDYEIEKNQVIRLWMAQGFLQISKEGELMEDIGEEFIRILCTISFFQFAAERETDEGTKLYYKMHDLVHDVAQHLSTFECKDLVDAKDEKINENIRHISLISNNQTLEIPNDINKVKKLRSFYSFSSYGDFYDRLKVTTSLPKLLQLRFLLVLNLSKLPLKELPSSIGGLKLLKYLDLSESNIERLPSTIFNLYHLQTFDLSYCYNLFELPKSVVTFTQLRHFYTFNFYPNWESPRGLNELTFLQTLDILKLCAESASEHIAELEHLNYLGGTLRLQNLGYVNDVEALKKGNLMGKKNLHGLDMNWESGTQGDNVSHRVELLEALQPHYNLKDLTIQNFQGLELPGWMTNDFALPNLVKLRLNGCRKWKEIKSLGNLSVLKKLVIERMDSLRRIGEDHHHHQVAKSSTTTTTGSEAAAILYPNLEELSIRDVPNLEEWFENSASIFPKLRVLELLRCPKLRSMPNHFPSLQYLIIVEVNNTDMVRSITTSFSLGGSSSSSSSEKEEEEVARMLGKNELLESLTVSGLSLMRHISDFSGLQFLRSSLKDLNIDDCPQFQGFLSSNEEQIGSPPPPLLSSSSSSSSLSSSSWCVESLSLQNCPSILRLQLRGFTQLRSLRISSCKALETCPHPSSSLKYLNISNCPQFQGFLSSNEEQIGSPPPPPPSSSSSSWCVESLSLYDCPSILRLQLHGFTQLQELTVWGCRGLQSLEGLQSLRNIRSLSIGQFSEELDHFPFLDAITGMEMANLISSLRSLSISGWSRLKSLPEQIQYLSRLEFLNINDFDGMTDLPEWFGKLTSLETLTIWGCKNLMHLPSANEMQKLTSLRTLTIRRCPLLKERCKPPKKRCGLGSGSSEWHKIPRITKVDVDEENEDDSSCLSRLVNKMRSKVC